MKSKLNLEPLKHLKQLINTKNINNDAILACVINEVYSNLDSYISFGQSLINAQNDLLKLKLDGLKRQVELNKLIKENNNSLNKIR